MSRRWSNPIAFTPLPVTIIGSLIYTALIIILLVIHLVVPSAPSNHHPVAGVNLDEAWEDLQYISGEFHPYNSRRNDGTRDYLLKRIEGIIAENTKRVMFDRSKYIHQAAFRDQIAKEKPAIVFSDITSNTTCSREGKSYESTAGRKPGTSVYFEGTNIIVYIRGSEDGSEEWWKGQDVPEKGGVLVSAHYDSVSTGYGATDDGVGVVTILQLIKRFTTPGYQPKRGIVALLNNGEEDYLNGARAFSQHPMSNFTHTFLNVEGAGAGGRAVMFRSTDTEVTRAYQKSQHPFATVISGDAFKRGLIKSETDYVVFNGLLGLRGLDLSFYAPRARYHTNQDDAKHTSINSIWHMLSASISTTEALSSDISSVFDGPNVKNGKVSSGSGSNAVWFDLYGNVLAVFKLSTLFALSVSLLVVTPLILISVMVLLYKFDKLYLFGRRQIVQSDNTEESTPLHGWKGFFRYPVVLALASAAVIGLAYLVVKLNPYIIYSSPFSVWSMMLSAWVFIAWFASCAIDFWRPTALHRLFSLLWLFAAGWVVLVAVTALERRQSLAGGYFLVFYFIAIFLATSVALSEQFGLSRRSEFVEEMTSQMVEPAPSHRSYSISSGQRLAQTSEEQPEDPEHRDGENENGEEATETTSLLRNDRHTTFAHYPHRTDTASHEQTATEEEKDRKVYLGEQAWSHSLPTWSWLLQFLLLSIIPITMTGQIGLLLTTSIHQTIADGSSTLLPYLSIAILTILILIPISPYIHRYTYHIPTFLFLVFAGTLIYNLLAFPFSPNNRLKLFFIQRVNLDTGINTVSLTGISDGAYLSDAVAALPSSAGQEISCKDSDLRPGLTECSWQGLAPQVVPAPPPESGIPPQFGYSDWLHFKIVRDIHSNSTRPWQKETKNKKASQKDEQEAKITLWGRNSRACRIVFSSPISDFYVLGAGSDARFRRVPQEGSKEIRLWSRTWEKPFEVVVKWNGSSSDVDGDDAWREKRTGRQKTGRGKGLDGKVMCLWSDANDARNTIPALEEAWRFGPDWVAISKIDDGLVEGSKAFLI